MNTTNKYQEDIAVTAGGTELLGGPAVISNITVCLESSGTAIISFSDSITTYKVANRCAKIVLVGPITQQIVFPGGLQLATGLCATSNLSSVDVSLSYN